MEGAKIHAENSIRQKNQALNYRRMSARIDAVAARVQTAVTTKQACCCLLLCSHLQIRTSLTWCCLSNCMPAMLSIHVSVFMLGIGMSVLLCGGSHQPQTTLAAVISHPHVQHPHWPGTVSIISTESLVLSC